MSFLFLYTPLRNEHVWLLTFWLPSEWFRSELPASRCVQKYLDIPNTDQNNQYTKHVGVFGKSRCPFLHNSKEKEKLPILVASFCQHIYGQPLVKAATRACQSHSDGFCFGFMRPGCQAAFHISHTLNSYCPP